MVITVNAKMSELEGPAKEFFLKKKKKKVMLIMRKKGKNREDKTEGWPLFTAVPKQESRGTGKDWRDWQKPKERHKIL